MAKVIKFVPEAAKIAKDKMDAIQPALSAKFVQLISFLSDYPTNCSAPRSKSLKDNMGGEEHIESLANNFYESRKPKVPSPPKTFPDEVVSLVLNISFDIREEDLSRIKYEHAISMGAENIVGELLERYLAEKLEPLGWIWCSGTSVKSVDFIKYDEITDRWHLLQVKNRNNTENSSSSKVRDNTDIKKWFRTFSQRDATNWATFPDDVSTQNLSEDDFRLFVTKYLNSLK
ncbi:SinI restriction endonuclease [Serratia marcescens]|uniref:SinI family restriction endonuclease n=1 Tax=Serratia TaxID=613 RepID=UPI000F7D95A3|nr:SinI family restriction endonuclease [Serratia marcescens]EGS5642106.1 SinI family restriction endonuclease [Serratia marcescens]EIJ9188199.1 SinI family restriction endonuclease [Serratia marcescens]EIY4263333.1 SinI family restriction endonuclease [Serratia marcescens]MBH2522635.1 SinI family restriction endonuclease [Serratia marcescens]MBH2643230.1 SinI family restriction endonuclease [Serratia marcescens]